jgi:hypothetical protein
MEIGVKNKAMNSSMIDNYNNPLPNDSDGGGEEESIDLITQYKKALLGENTQNSKTQSKKRNNSQIKEERSQNENKERTMPKFDLFDSNLYKINIRNASAWDKDKVNNIVYNPINKTKSSAK